VKARLDSLLVDRGLVDSREQGRRLILAGEVTVDGQLVDKPGTRVPADARLEVRQPPPYVSRGGLKLAAALDEFDLPVGGLVAADVGASTGGFTDCLLQRGAARVYAIDVGYGQLDWRLRQDPRVVVMERTNARHLGSLPEPVDLVVIDVSFISLTLILPPAFAVLKPDGHVVCLVKPQFELARALVGKGGIVRDPALHLDAVDKIRSFVAGPCRRSWAGLIESPITGADGNREFLAWIR